MNQDQVKDILLQLRPDTEEFDLLFSGKSSKKVNGLYKPDSREIIIHNKNFTEESALLYTAVHEFAHHIHFTESVTPVGSRSHTTAFRRILHTLLARGEEMGILENLFTSDPEFRSLTEEIKGKCLNRQGELARELGRLLMKAEELCRRHGRRFEDYVERILQLDTSHARFAIRAENYDLPASLGYENMKLVASKPKEDERRQLTEVLEEGESRDRARGELAEKQEEEKRDPVDTLMKEKERVQKSILKLQNKLEDLESRIRTAAEKE